METDNIQSLEMVEVLSNEYKHQIFFFFYLMGQIIIFYITSLYKDIRSCVVKSLRNQQFVRKLIYIQCIYHFVFLFYFFQYQTLTFHPISFSPAHFIF